MRAEKQGNGTRNSTKKQGTSPPLGTRFACRAAACLMGLLGSLSAASAETYVCGSIAGQHWTTNGSPYRVTCDINVALLTIDPGVTVLFQSNYLFDVDGFLTAAGTASAPITFTRTNGGGWKGIFFNYCANGSEMDYCNVSAVDGGSAIKCISANPLLRSCVVFNNASPGEGGGLYVDNRNYPGGDIVVQGCIFTNNTSASHGGAVSAHTGTNVIRFVGCSLIGNTANPGRAALNPVVGGGVYMDGNASFDTCTNEQNAVYSSGPDNHGAYYSAHGGGIYWSGSGSMRNTFVCHNTCQSTSGYTYAGTLSYGGGIFLSGGSLALQNCVIAYNNTYASARWPDPRGGGYYQASGSSTSVNCTIAYNNIEGSRIDGGSATAENCIFYFNNGGGAQIISGAGVTGSLDYSDVQGGVVTGTGNIAFNPAFADPNSLTLAFSSRCIDAGDPHPAYNDVCLTPCGLSLGTVTNDMGAYGGPGACGWTSPCTPIIQAQPQDQVGCLSHSATFTVNASGNGSLSYLWYFNTNASIPWATNASLTLTNLQATNAGKYSVVVSSQYGSTNSRLAQLTLYDPYTEIEVEPYFDSYIVAGLYIAGQPNSNYVLKYTTDLSKPWAAWMPLATNKMDGSGWFFYVDEESPFSPYRFYGAKLKP